MVSVEGKKILQEYDNYLKDFMENIGEMPYPKRVATESNIIMLTLFLEKIFTQKPLISIHDKYHLNFDKMLGKNWKL